MVAFIIIQTEKSTECSMVVKAKKKNRIISLKILTDQILKVEETFWDFLSKVGNFKSIKLKVLIKKKRWFLYNENGLTWRIQVYLETNKISVEQMLFDNSVKMPRVELFNLIEELASIITLLTTHSVYMQIGVDVICILGCSVFKCMYWIYFLKDIFHWKLKQQIFWIKNSYI